MVPSTFNIVPPTILLNKNPDNKNIRTWILFVLTMKIISLVFISVDYFHLDLSSLKSVEEFVKNFLNTGLPLHILINNGKIKR